MRICRALNLDRNESVEVLSRICQRQKSVSMDQESIKQTECTEIWLDESKKLSRTIEKREIRLDRKRICRGSVEKLSSLKKRSFSREEKHIKRNATSKLPNQRSNQHVKLLRHLSTYKHSIHRSKNTHTHTRTKQV